ncbi:L-seryl-tRNA(Sec) selenium transferase [Herbivorax sp. ANBcel31]|uniref:L-seryl-tRNA(Sec) selenium transferase n=1 Tax=Herbivorax sp. ANBcel31 TaxID=3069754 RepID=UPI0027B4473A|nr:L-seryl-tRNA(Sec) selenium transferase [Herbivorax sp. ANBcel31]MDQ2087900.1 L-seryl-tRNA(Sec) selenium transferase [Herbivorax sp. ANBcel31]
MDKNKELNLLRGIPPVNDFLEEKELSEFLNTYGRSFVLEKLRGILDKVKTAIRKEENYCIDNFIETTKDVRKHIIDKLIKSLKTHKLHTLRKVINATGIVLHTNLGRAPVPEKALQKVVETSSGYCNLEYDLEKGSRGSRYNYIEGELCRLTGAEAGVIVNNNAAAVFLCLNTFAKDREVVVSRGEQVEIGGQFRVPDIIRQSGCSMVEVGATNKTHAWDYENAINENTAMLLKVHTSNYRITGFSSSVTLNEIKIAQNRDDIIRVEDLGSGCLINLSMFDVTHERSPVDCLKEGADLVTFSGDKLLGGPQAGLIIGKKQYIEKIKKNPLTRMVRCDKMTIAAISAVLKMYSLSESEMMNIPALSMLSQKKESLEKKAQELAKVLSQEIGKLCDIDIIDVEEEAGGGSLPGTVFDGKAVAITPFKDTPDNIRDRLRRGEIPIVCRILENRLIFHVRTLKEGEFNIVATSLRKAL